MRTPVHFPAAQRKVTPPPSPLQTDFEIEAELLTDSCQGSSVTSQAPTCPVTFQDAAQLVQELLQLRVLLRLWVRAALDCREESGTHQGIGHQAAEETEARQKLAQGLRTASPGFPQDPTAASPGLRWLLSFHPLGPAQGRTGGLCGGGGGNQPGPRGGGWEWPESGQAPALSG